jgi:hypothetical protein
MKPARAGTRRFLPTSPFQAPPDPPPAEQFAVQDQVTHDKHGLGRVISIENETALVIDFGTQKVRIMTPCAKLTKLLCRRRNTQPRAGLSTRQRSRFAWQHERSACGSPGHNDRVDIGVVLGAVNAELGGRWRLERRLAGGWNEGAYLLIGGGGSRTVLKWRASDPERLLGAREPVEAARARGWPAPQWLATGQAPTGEAWVVQEFIDGRTPARLWAYAAGLDRREFAVCAGSVGLTMAESFLRHGRAGQAAGAVPGMVRTLEQALALAIA